ncbi:MAG: Rieske 2Fe-2S domain-containing protein [Actinomycetota bacterium]|nr:Rieske 2Fe-2S domain-containing protein [Actinomycetota bacterium]
MSATTVFILIIVAAGAIAAFGIIAVALRRKDSEGAVTQVELDRQAAKADRVRREVMAQASVGKGGGTAVATVVAPPTEYTEDEPRTEISEAEYGVTRRKFFNRAIAAVFGLFMLQFALASLAFLWPKLGEGGFGSEIKAGSFEEIKADVLQEGRIIPKFVPAAQSWIVPFELEQLAGSSYEATPFVIAGGESDGIGLMALWQRCVHLGCRVPECLSSQGFECPCHGSRYNGHGEYDSGPAPRNMDRFAVSIDSAGDLIIDTGTVVQTARSKNKTIPYPQGPFCV